MVHVYKQVRRAVWVQIRVSWTGRSIVTNKGDWGEVGTCKQERVTSAGQRRVYTGVGKKWVTHTNTGEVGMGSCVTRLKREGHSGKRVCKGFVSEHKTLDEAPLAVQGAHDTLFHHAHASVAVSLCAHCSTNTCRTSPRSSPRPSSSRASRASASRTTRIRTCRRCSFTTRGSCASSGSGRSRSAA